MGKRCVSGLLIGVIAFGLLTATPAPSQEPFRLPDKAFSYRRNLMDPGIDDHIQAMARQTWGPSSLVPPRTSPDPGARIIDPRGLGALYIREQMERLKGLGFDDRKSPDLGLRVRDHDSFRALYIQEQIESMKGIRLEER